jgi:hypothetical protein
MRALRQAQAHRHHGQSRSVSCRSATCGADQLLTVGSPNTFLPAPRSHARSNLVVAYIYPARGIHVIGMQTSLVSFVQ